MADMAESARIRVRRPTGAGGTGGTDSAVVVGVLGATAVLAGGREATFPRRTARLLACLVVADRQVVPRERLTAVLWGGRPPASASTMLREHVKRIRDVIGCPGRDMLVSERDGYVLSAPPQCVDAARFEAGVDEAMACRAVGDRVAAVAGLQEALASWRGPAALSDVRDVETLRCEAERLDERRVLAEVALVECLLETGAPAEALPLVRLLVQRHPGRERLWTLVILCESLLGWRAEASESFRRGVRSLRSSGGLDPSPQVHAVHRELLEGAAPDRLLALAGLEPVRLAPPGVLAPGRQIVARS